MSPLMRRRPRTLAHLSDLHFGRSLSDSRAAHRLADALKREEVDHVVVTGDVTHRGRRSQFAEFEGTFAPWISAGRLTLVPGNHDRAGEDAGAWMMGGQRVSVRQSDDLYLVCLDSTGPHNRTLLASHGRLCEEVLGRIDAAFDHAPAGSLCALLLHHHVLPLPEESWAERLATLLGWPYASELPLGLTLLDRIEGRCDLVLHGHRHVPRAFQLNGRPGRPLGLFNAGSSTELGAFRVFTHRAGSLAGSARWVHAEGMARRLGDTEQPSVDQQPVGLLVAGSRASK